MGEPEAVATTTTIQLCATLSGAPDARERQLALLRAVVATAAGATETGGGADALLVSFASAPDAAACAVEMQQRVEADNRTADVPGALRIALGLAGSATRLCTLAGAGQILVDA